MHTDEAVNAYIVGELLAGKPFLYDPRDRHGPALAALALPLARMQGAHTFADLTEPELRLSSVLAGTITILLFAAALEFFGFLPCLVAALLFAVAPLPVYYDRYFIHESFFCTATLATILTACRWWKRRTAARAAWIGACAALMAATKETCILHFAALGLAGVMFWLWNLRGLRLGHLELRRSTLPGLGALILVSFPLFTWFGSNWKVFPDLLHAAPNFFLRATGGGHAKPIGYYVELLAGGWSGGILLSIACVGIVLTLRKREASPNGFLAFYALLIGSFYSLIPYKTPWLALSLWLPLALFVGVAIDLLLSLPFRYPRLHIALCAVMAVLLAATIAHDTWQRVFRLPADEANPYAYAHTSEDLPGLPAEIDRLAHQSAMAAPRIAVIAADPWPLPWYLRHFSAVGYWQPGQQPEQADFYITSSEAVDPYKDRLRDFRPEVFGARPSVFVLLWSREPR